MVHNDHLLHAWCNLVCRLQRVTSARLHLFRRLGGDFPQFQCYVAFHYWVCLTHETLLPPNGQALYSAVLRAGTPVDTSTVVANAKDSEAVSNSFPIGGVHLRPSLMKLDETNQNQMSDVLYSRRCLQYFDSWFLGRLQHCQSMPLKRSLVPWATSPRPWWPPVWNSM